MDGKRQPTIQDIAREAGVSVGTVDRALHGRGRISDETRSRVLEAARKLNYRPNLIARALARRRSLRFAVIYPRHPSSFWREVDSGVRRAMSELAQFKVSTRRMTVKGHDVESERELLRKALREGVNGIAIAPADPTALKADIDGAVEDGVAVVTLNTDAPESKRMCFVGQDGYRAGRVASELMGKMVPSGSVAILNGFESVHAHAERCRGFLEELQSNFASLRVVTIVETQEKPEVVRRLVKDIVRRYEDLSGIYVVSGGDLEPAGRMLVEMGRQKLVKLIGHDLGPGTRQLLDRGVVYATICQQPFLQGYLPLRLLYEFCSAGRRPDTEQLLTQLDIVLRGNMDLIANGVITGAGGCGGPERGVWSDNDFKGKSTDSSQPQGARQGSV